MDPLGDGVNADFQYVSPDSRLNLRWSGDGTEANTGRFEPHPVFVRNARAATEPLTLETGGFQLVRHETDADFYSPDIGPVHFPEIEKLLLELTGADKAVVFHGLRRNVAKTGGVVYGAGTDVHVDYCVDEAHRLAHVLLGLDSDAALPYRRFMAINLWRAISAPPQDRPLAVCDARSVATQSGALNTLIEVDRVPEPDERMKSPANVDELPKGWIFHHDPAHRWYYYPSMTRDELLLFKLYDSSEEGPWRCPHAAFTDPSAPMGASPRESYELRSFVYFK